MRKGQILKKLVPKSKKFELNSTNLKLKYARTCLICNKKPDASISYGLRFKTKMIRVLLDYVLSGDLFFVKNGRLNTFLLWSGLSLSFGTLPTVPLILTRWVTLTSSLRNIPPARRFAFSRILWSTTQGDNGQYRLVWVIELSLAVIGLIFPVLVLGYKLFNCSIYHVSVPTWIEECVWLYFKQLLLVAGSVIFWHTNSGSLQSIVY